MNRTILVISLAFSLGLLAEGKAYAQRYLPGQKGIQLSAGAVDGFEPGRQDFCFGAALSAYTGNGNRWVYGGEYLQKGYGYKDRYIPAAQFTGEGGYYFNLLSDGSRTLSLSAGISAMAGYETVNWGKKVLSDGATVVSRDGFLYGGAISLEMEAFLSDRIVLLLNARERILAGSSVDVFHSQLGIGIKLIIN